MPMLFYRSAYEAACLDAPPARFSELNETHFESDAAKLEEALGWLTSEQLCDAFYGDWLLQLHRPGGETQLQVRSLLIGQGALAANYLAELAQNADDAFDESEGAEVRLIVSGDWLLVANNGRRLTPGNLRGLCRFFVHRGGELRPLDEETIGRFGIGFKSCYRIASEVLIRSWDPEGEINFRLPISRADEPSSWADPDRQRRIVERLLRVDELIGDDQMSVDRLGYCTPEALNELPDDIPKESTELQIFDRGRGTFFAFRLHAAGASEVRQRISGQENELYELCPLFLPKVRAVRLGQSFLKMEVGRNLQSNGLAGRVAAVHVTLETERENGVSRDRFWRLTGIEPEDCWQIALHADSGWLLNFKNDDDAAFSLREGGAYAFFPLNDANRDFFFRFHLHINLPTNLSRGDWNDEERDNVRAQIGRAIDGLAAWLERHPDKRHANWQVEGLFRREPHEGAAWSYEIYDRLKSAVAERTLLRTLWGDWRRASDALTVRLDASSVVRRAWGALCARADHLGGKFSFVETLDQIDLGIPAASGPDLAAFFSEAARHPSPTADYWQNMLHSILGVEALSPSQIEQALGSVRVELASGEVSTAADVMQRAGGAELSENWHSAFRSAAAWLQGQPRAMTAIFGEPLSTRLVRLGNARFSVEWEEMAAKFATADVWVAHGERFWKGPHSICPLHCRDEVVASLRVKDGSEQWKSMTAVWLVDSSSVSCLAGIVGPWDCGAALNHGGQKLIRDRLQKWGLWDGYLQALDDRLESLLADQLRSLSLAELSASPRRNSRVNLPIVGLRRLVEAAERSALEYFLGENPPPAVGTRYLSNRNEDVPFTLRRILQLTLPDYLEAPEWLTSNTWGFFGDHRMEAETGFEYVDTINAERRTEIAKEILRGFWRWKDRAAEFGDPASIAELNNLFAGVKGTWEVRLAKNSAVFLNQLFARTVGGEQTSATRVWDRMIESAGRIEWYIKFLPEPLNRVARIVEVCLGPESLRVGGLGGGRNIPLARVAPDILAIPEVSEVLKLRDWQVESFSSLELTWKAQSNLVCEVHDAVFAFAFDRDRFYVSRQVVDENEEGYQRVLGAYDLLAPEDREYRAARRSGQSSQQLFDRFREKIVEVLCDRYVVGEGYEERHVLRELLQNAESAYASRAGDDLDACPFAARSELVGKGVRITVSHRGRSFDEPDTEGSERADIARIVSLAAENRNVPGEIGRFNRGFKSVFTVTTDVRVRSGAYDFRIEDLLLLDPPEPGPNAEFLAETRFSFECVRGDANKLFGNAGGRSFSVFHAASFVFLKYVTDISLEHGGGRRHWVIQRKPLGNGWSEVAIAEEAEGETERFLVFADVSAREDGRRIGAAIRLGLGDTVREIEPAWNRLCLTFPTETPGPGGVLINGDFDTDGGRVEMRRSATNEGLIKSALEAVKERLRADASAGIGKEEWLGWARALAVSDARKWVGANFPNDPLGIGDVLDECGKLLADRVPHDGDWIVPSRLMRRLSDHEFAADWEIGTSRWLDPEIEQQMEKIARPPSFSLASFALTLAVGSDRADRVLKDLQGAEFRREIKLDAIDSREWEEAVKLLATIGTAAGSGSGSRRSESDFQLRPIDIEEVLDWWKENDDPDGYTLDSDVLWEIFGPSDFGAGDRREHLIGELSSSGTPEGRGLWYRVLGFACLMSAGWPVERILGFWREELGPVDFWEKTARGFAEGDTTFEEAILRQTRGANSVGENATFWRRIFYDVRKIRYLIYENDFAEVVLEVATDPGDAGHLLQFLRTGRLPGERPWKGVIGQSAGSPLFFVVRELRRLGVIPHPAADAGAFFVCTPVRRLAARLGWIDARLEGRTDFESLGEASRRIHAAAVDADADLFEQWFDIPLLHYAIHHR